MKLNVPLTTFTIQYRWPIFLCLHSTLGDVNKTVAYMLITLLDYSRVSRFWSQEMYSISRMSRNYWAWYCKFCNFFFSQKIQNCWNRYVRVRWKSIVNQQLNNYLIQTYHFLFHFLMFDLDLFRYSLHM